MFTHGDLFSKPNLRRIAANLFENFTVNLFRDQNNMTPEMRQAAKKGLRQLYVLCFLMILFIHPAAAQSGDFKVTGGTLGTDYTYDNGVLKFIKGGEYTIGMAEGVTESNHRIEVNIDDSNIKLTLSGLKMNGDNDSNIYFAYAPQLPEIEIVLDGDNFIKNENPNGKCIKVFRVQYNTKISGSGTLTLESANSADDWSSRSFTFNLDDETGKIITKDVAFTASYGDGIYINSGTIDITSDESCIYTTGEFYMTGGKLIAKNTSDYACISVTGEQDKRRGPGFYISGGEINLTTPGTNGGSGIMLYRNNNYEKAMLITGNGKITMDCMDNRPTGIILVAPGNDFTIEGNGILEIKGVERGIKRNNPDSTVTFNGGETEITSSDHALFDIPSDALRIGADYSHKDYAGGSEAARTETEDTALVDGTGYSASYLLITPKYSITYDLKGGALPSGTTNPDTYTRADSFTLNNPALEGSTFTGWTGSNGDSPNPSLTIPEGTKGNLTYTANWRKSSFSVTSSAGAGMIKTYTSGPARQTVSNGTAIQSLVYITDSDHYFPTDYQADPISGISVTRISASQIEVSGTPTADVTIILPDAALKSEKEPTPNAVFTGNDTDAGKLTGLVGGAEYILRGAYPDSLTFIAPDDGTIELTGISAGTVTLIRKGGDVKKDSDPQSINITKPEIPNASKSDCTTSENNDGKLLGVTAEMEYRKAGTDEWITGNENAEITGLEPGTYFVRVKGAVGSLASENQILTIEAYEAPVQTEYNITVVSDGNGTASADRTTGQVGDTVTLNAEANDGYQFKEWKVLSGDVTIDADNRFQIGTKDVFILALFEKTGEVSCQVRVSVMADENGRASIVSTGETLNLITMPDEGYQFGRWQVMTGVVSVIDETTFLVGNDDVELLAVFEEAEEPVCPEPPVPPAPERPETNHMDFFRLMSELPMTGITDAKEKMMPFSVNYTPLNMVLQIPSLDVSIEIVNVPATEEGYPVENLGANAGLLSGSALPGEGISVIAGHNTLNETDYGPFALLSTMREGDRFFVNHGGELLTYEVYRNAKIGASDVSGLESIAGSYANTITLLTCEDELPAGGYAARRVVAAKLVD